MANFRTQVDDLTAFTTTDDVALASWLADGCKQIISTMPKDKLVDLASESDAFAPTTGESVTTPVIGVTRMTAASNGITYQCRQIPMNLRYEAQDEDNILYATETDPVFYIESQSSGNSKVKILPTSSSELAKLTKINYPTPSVTDTSIETLPDEYEYLVVIYAAIKAVEQLLATEEDFDLYDPMLKNLKQDYATGLAIINPRPPQQIQQQPPQQRR